MKKDRVYKIAVVGVMAAVATAIYLLILEVPIIPGAPHIKVGFSDIPVLIAGLTVGPLGGILVALIKCLFHLLQPTTTFGIGELIKFLINTAMVLAMVYSFRFFSRLFKTKKSGLPAFAATGVVTALVSVVAAWGVNFLLAPVLLNLLGVQMAMEEIVAVYVFGSTIVNVVNAILNIIPAYPIYLALKRAGGEGL